MTKPSPSDKPATGGAPNSGNDNALRPWLTNYPVDVDWHQKFEGRPMTDLLDDAVKKHGDKNFLTFMGKKYTYKEVGEMADRAARGFQEMGIKKGSKVALCLPNSPFYVASYYGALKAGATVVNMNPLYAEKELAHLAKDSEAEALVTLDMESIYPKLGKLIGGDNKLKKIVTCSLSDALPFPKGQLFNAKNWVDKTFRGKKMKPEDRKYSANLPKDATHTTFRALIDNDGKYKKVDIDPDKDLAVLQYTGGTTGLPKGAMLTHSNLYINTQQTKAWFEMGTEEDRKNGKPKGREKILAVLPFFHVFAMTAEMNFSIAIGAELDMKPNFDLKETIKTIHKDKPTIFAGVPAIYKAIADDPSLTKYDLSSLKYCMAGGAPLSSELKKDFEAKTGCILFEGYGLSETSPLATANPLRGLQKPNSIGLPVPGMDVRIRDPEFPTKDQPVNVKGEICLRGPQLMKGYWNREDATKEAIDKDGFFHTGDIGYMDEDGFVFIVDRIKDMIITNGYNVYPSNVETALAEHPGVSECLVIGVPDEKRGETVKAFVVMKPGEKELSRDEFKDFLKDKLSPIQMPKDIEYRKELPKTLIGKPDRKALVEEERIKREGGSNQPPAVQPRRINRRYGM
ncbi:MAG: long-chain fatty acid--CoA ligase [Micavibrio sp.]|jgi:long-chain acyl-CoA synthetase|nr:MAG: long-chain fatty acid--CoA ligase [Micavibrio sp.]